MTPVYLSLILVMLTFYAPQLGMSLSCIPCGTYECPAVPTNCGGGLTKDICGCCDVCAKVAGETCGGPFEIDGTCDRNLRCHKEDPDDFNASGICVRTTPEKCSVAQQEYSRLFEEWKTQFGNWKQRFASKGCPGA